MQADLVIVDPKLLSKWNIPVPRYTSYPTAPQYYPVTSEEYSQRIEKFDASDKPLSIYIHIPFCKTMCLFCACSVVLNRKMEKQKAYLKLLLEEIRTLPFQKKRVVSQLHLGGGTPTSLTEGEFDSLMKELLKKFAFSPNAEISIEIDPRTVFADAGKKLKHLRKLGFNRVSFGVQDLNENVQEAIKRRQSEEMTVATYERAREIGFLGVNLDLIYGLPLQTRESFAKTSEKIALLKPDRISFFSYAKVPWLKPHQKAIPDEWLPSDEEKFGIYTDARERFMETGYTAIGMDHFSLPKDPLSIAYQEKKIVRNFQGYSLSLAEDMIGLGVTSIGFLENGYFQNRKEIEEYGSVLNNGKLPVERGYILKEDDSIRRFVIQRIMCHFEIDKKEFEEKFGIPLDLYFVKERSEVERLIQEGLLEERKSGLYATPTGRLFVRLIASAFDAYMTHKRYSKAI